jgi:hypothetical protein
MCILLFNDIPRDATKIVEEGTTSEDGPPSTRYPCSINNSSIFLISSNPWSKTQPRKQDKSEKIA